MKEKKLFILNYQREIPPFLINEIKAATPLFDRIYYVSPKLYNDNRKNADFGKTSFVIGSKMTEFVSFILLPFLFFTPKSIKNIATALKNKRLSFSFIKHHFIQLYEARTLVHLSKKIVKKNTSGILVSSWFNACAIATGILASSRKHLIPISFAHAFEVQPSINAFLGCDFDSFKLSRNKKIVFISGKVKQVYINFMKKYGIEKYENKIKHRYLGTFKPNEIQKFDHPKRKDKIHMLSCSSMVPIKRIHLIIEILKEMKSDIIWTHIGGGPLFEKIKLCATEAFNGTDNVTFEFLGSLSNKDVINYYANNYVDLFINTSESEGLPVSIMEAFSFGVPVLATNVGGTSEIVDCDTGFLIEKDFNAKQVAELLDGICNNIQQLDYMKTNCFKKWEYYFNIEKNVFGFYSQLINEEE